MERAAEFALVKAVRATMSQIACTASAKTKADYAKKFERMRRTKQWPEQIAKTRRSYFAYRAAFLFGLSEMARQALRQRDKFPESSPERMQALRVLTECQQGFERYPPDPDRHHLEEGSTSFTWSDVAAQKQGNGETSSRHSKKYALNALNKHPDWRQKLFAEIPPMYQMAAAVCALTGCRPGELEKGVRLKRDGDCLLFLIDGLKVSDVAGQAQRFLKIRIESVEAQFLAEHLAAEPILVSVRSAKAFSESVAKAGRKAFPKLQDRVSPYVWRHAMASDLKSSQVDADTIAQALGHRVSRTQEHYGRAAHGGCPVALVDVQATLQIRDTARPAMSSSAPSISPRFG